MLYKLLNNVLNLHKTIVLFIILVAVSACAAPSSRNAVYDPFEPANRSIHAFNKGLDRAVIGPAAKAYTTVTPTLIVRMIDNFANYLSLPAQAANNILQGDAIGFKDTLLRATLNTLTFGVGDLATNAGVPDNDADFGQTLHVWGLPQGAYLELPILGPSTARDTAGIIVDTVLDPVNFIVPSDLDGERIGLVVLDSLEDRDRNKAIIEGTIYTSEDSYKTARTIYLQNRNFKLNRGKVRESDLEDPNDF